MIRTLLVLVLVSLVGCKSDDGARRTEPTTPEPSAPAAAAPDAPPADASDCVAQCVAARQMQATSAEKIEADCRAECEGK